LRFFAVVPEELDAPFRIPTPIERRREAITQRDLKSGYKGRVCLTCLCALPVDARRHKRFCSSGCRVNFWRRVKIGIRDFENECGECWTVRYLERVGEMFGVVLGCSNARDQAFRHSPQERTARRKTNPPYRPRQPGELTWNQYKALHGIDDGMGRVQR
jgi:hypothetical protein